MCLNIPNVTTSATLCVREVLATVFVQIQVQGILAHVNCGHRD